MKSIFLAGEDDVTKACIKKIIYHCDPETVIITDLPARGGQLKSLINQFNRLSLDNPVILLTDLDNNSCPPELISKLFQGIVKEPDFVFNIACDEAESWLMADKENFCNYFGIPIQAIPGIVNIGSALRPYHELGFPVKSSFYLVNNIIPLSNQDKTIKMMAPAKGSYKGPEYNSAITPFITNHWNIENASVNSDSLRKCVSRITRTLLS